MVENDEKHWKIMKKVPFSSCAREAHDRLTKKNKQKISFLNVFFVFDHAGQNTQHTTSLYYKQRQNLDV